MTRTVFSFPTRIVFGAGSLAGLPAILAGEGVRRPLVVTDRGLVATGLVERLTAVLERGGLAPEVFSDVSGNPTSPEVQAGVRRYREAAADGVVGFGGGSALDVSKAVRLMATHPGDILDYDEAAGGTDRIHKDMPFMAAIATTAGTGSEVGRSTVITDPVRRVKRIVFSPHLMAGVVVADPELLVGLPPHLTAATGMDALTHCVEAFLATGYHPMCDAVALGGIRLVADHLAGSVEDGRDIEARAGMLMAAMMGAVAFQKGLGVTHSLAHPLSTLAGVHHGQANGILLWRALEFNLPSATGRLAQIARTLDLEPGASAPARARAAIDWVRRLADGIGIPARLSQVGVTADLLEPMVRQAVEDGCHQTNPRPCKEEDFRRLYQEAL